jgi:hypothetical protein
MLNGTFNPNDKQQQLTADYYYNNMVRNNAPTQQLLAVPLKTGYVPETMQAQILNAASNSDPKQVAQAAQMMTTIQAQRPDAFRGLGTKDPATTTFLMNVANLQAGGMPADRAVAAAQKASVDGVTSTDLTKIHTESQRAAANHINEVIPDGGIGNLLHGTPQVPDYVTKFAHDAFQASYMQYRETPNGMKDPSSAVSLAATDVKNMMGVSSVNGARQINILPPENFSKLEGPDIAKNVLNDANARLPQGVQPFASMVMKADNQSIDEYKNGKPPTYSVTLINPKTGALIPDVNRYTADGRLVSGQ